MHGTYSKSASSSSNNRGFDTDSMDGGSSDHEINPKSVSARLSAGMMPYFIPPPPQSDRQLCLENAGKDNAVDPTLMTPPMSPTERSFVIDSTIESRFASMSHKLTFLPDELHLPPTDMTHTSTLPQQPSSPAPSGPFSTVGSSSMVPPRPASYHWDDYHGFEEEDEDHGYRDGQDSDDQTDSDLDDHEDDSKSRGSYYRQFEGHHSLVRRSSFGGKAPEDRYDSHRHGIGLNVSDVSEELAKTRSKMLHATRAMKAMEEELEAMQSSINDSKASSASARSAIEENFWRLECLALTLEKDRQDTNKQLQSVGRDCSEAVESVTNWEVRIDWLGRRVDNTSEYVSELVLSDQECMSFIKMIIQQNRRYAMPAISQSTERNIRLMAPPRLKEISHPAHQPSISPRLLHPELPQPRYQPQPQQPQQPQPQPQPQPQSQPQSQPMPQPSPRLGHIPVSWLLDPMLPPKSPDISSPREYNHQSTDESSKANATRKQAVETPPELWRDFSRLTMAFESGQARTPFSSFLRTRSHSIGQGNVMNAGSSSSSSSAAAGSNLFKPAIVRRPQAENLSSLPKILPATVATNKMSGVKRRSQNLSHLPVHSWLQFQFNKTMTTPGSLAGNKNKGKGKGKRTTVLGFKPITIFQATV
ncbi:hypothetical protein BG011_005083 [Mortierella polycephala]|uniref:Uncharacterized protein n=1 Tax=Mortierella polycephala TaxID=41804 RepID=A0A9P6U1T2_9FUNG|nr:hypothetical protein BG011_005083 [Mortierella polycephala]